MLASLIAVNVVAYRVLWRDNRSQSVFIGSATNMVDVIKEAEGGNLEEKVGNVIDENLDFSREDVSDEFNDMLFSYLESKGIDAKGKSLALEEKILYARMFSSTLNYNDKANLIVHAVDDDRISLEKAAESISEFDKVSSMDSEDIMDYRTVICGQFARVFVAALHSINDSSANPVDIHVAVLKYVPDYDSAVDGEMGAILPLFNAAVFAEYRKSVSHVINLVATDDKFYLTDPQYGANRLLFSGERLEIYNGYADKLKDTD